MKNNNENELKITIDDPNLIDIPIENIEITLTVDYVDTK